MANKRMYKDLRAKAKRANQRLVRLEKAGKKSPAYLAAQAKLEMLGRRAGTDIGRRFSETGKATYNEYEALSKVLDEFLAQRTSTVGGYTKYIDDVWAGALQSDKITTDLEKAGITKEQWFEMWRNVPDRKQRHFDSSEYIEALAILNVRNGKVENEELDIAALFKEFEDNETIKGAYKAIGISDADYDKAVNMGVL